MLFDGRVLAAGVCIDDPMVVAPSVCLESASMPCTRAGGHVTIIFEYPVDLVLPSAASQIPTMCIWRFCCTPCSRHPQQRGENATGPHVCVNYLVFVNPRVWQHVNFPLENETQPAVDGSLQSPLYATTLLKYFVSPPYQCAPAVNSPLFSSCPGRKAQKYVHTTGSPAPSTVC